MSETPAKNDFNAEWPEEIKQAYEHLKIPSLYDAVIANEKLSLEIRRQNRELKTVIEGIQTLSTQFNALVKIVEEEWEEDEEGSHSLQGYANGFQESENRELTDLEVEIMTEKQAQLILMETHDDMRELSRMTRQITQQILALLPKKEGIIISQLPSWYPAVEGMVQSVVEMTERSRYQLLSRLEGIWIETVDPQPGELFDKSLHHVLEHIPGGQSGTIAYVIRVGYRQHQDVLRLAEVTLYS